MIMIQYWINATFLIWGAWKIGQGDVKNGLYLITGFFVMCIVSYLLYSNKRLNSQIKPNTN